MSDSNGAGALRIALSPDGKLVASGGERGLVELRDTNRGELLHTFKHQSGSEIRTIVFSPASNQLATGDEKGEMRLWNTANGGAEDAVAHRDAVTDIAYSPLGAQIGYIASASKDASLRIIDRSPFSTMRIEEFRTDYALWHVAIDPYGLFAAIARGDGYVDIWGRRESRIVGRVPIASGDVATGVAFLADDMFAFVDGGGGVRFFQATAGRDAWMGAQVDNSDHLIVAPTGALVAADFAGDGALWMLQGGVPKRLPIVAPPLGASGFAPDGSRLAVVDGRADRLRVVKMPDGVEVSTWPVPTNIGAVAWHPLQESYRGRQT